jgi:hypothetical protein
MAVKVEVRRSSDGRLLMVVHLCEDSNLWFHSNGTASYVPKWSEVELMKDSLQAIDNHNIEKMLNKNLRKTD